MKKRRYAIDIIPAADDENPEVTITVIRHGDQIGEHTGALITALEHAQDFITRDLEADPL